MAQKKAVGPCHSISDLLALPLTLVYCKDQFHACEYDSSCSGLSLSTFAPSGITFVIVYWSFYSTFFLIYCK